MIANKGSEKQLPNEIKATFDELQVMKHLRKAGIKKAFGFTCVYLFQLIFSLIFENKNWFRMLESRKALDLPAKDAIYRFLNLSTHNWRRFLCSLSTDTIKRTTQLTHHSRPKALIIDDSTYERDRSKKVELLARCHDHSSQKKRYYKGFRVLTMGWSDGATFMPIDFTFS